MLHRRLHLLLPSTPQIDPLTHQKRVLRPGPLILRPTHTYLHLLVFGIPQLQIKTQILGNLGIPYAPVGIVLLQKRTIGVEARTGPAFAPEGGPVGAQVGPRCFDSIVGGCGVVRVGETVRLEHVAEEIVGGEVDFGGDGRLGSFGGAEEEA